MNSKEAFAPQNVLMLGDIPAFEPAVENEYTKRAKTLHTSIRRAQHEHRKSLQELAADLKIPHENRPKLAHQVASKTRDALEPLQEEVSGLRKLAEARRRSWLAGDGLAERAGGHNVLREVRTWLLTLPQSERLEVLSEAMRANDRATLVAVLTAPGVMGERLLPPDRRPLVAAQIDPDGQTEVESIEDAISHVQAAAQIAHDEAGRSVDRELEARDAFARAKRAAEAAREDGETSDEVAA